MSTLKDRIEEALLVKKASKRALAAACGVSPGAVMHWTSGRVLTLSAENALKASQFLGVSVEWLTTGNGEKTLPIVAVNDDEQPPEGVVVIPEYRIECGAGSAGEPTFEEITESKPAYYRADWFTAHGTSPEKCKRFTVHGDSMIPILFDGDSILVDCSIKKVTDGKIYAFSFDGDLRVKRLYKQLSGGLRILSENPAVPEERIDPCDIDRINIIGRVIDRSGSSPF